MDKISFAFVVYILVWITAIIGWILNIIKFVGMDFTHVEPMLVLRGIGIIMAPLGAVLGFM